MNRQAVHDYGCQNYWCMELRTGLARRADTAERAVRAQTHTIRALRGEIERLKTPDEPSPAEKYVAFKARAWVLFAVILILIGAALIGVVVIGEHIMSNTTFNDVRTPG